MASKLLSASKLLDGTPVYGTVGRDPFIWRHVDRGLKPEDADRIKAHRVE